MHPLLIDVAAGRDDLDSLRTALTHSCGPLRSPGDHGRTTLSFVWIGAADSVALQSGLTSGDVSVAMQRVGTTDVWVHEVDVDDDVLVSYRFVVDDPFLDAGTIDDAEWQRRMLIAQTRSFADPFNPTRIPPLAVLFGLPVEQEQYESILALRGSPHAPWFAAHDSPQGALTHFELESAVLGDRRRVSVYVPCGAGTDHPLVVLLDGTSFLSIAALPHALDLAVANGEFTPPVVAFVHPTQGSRGLADRVTELSCNPQYASMLATELVPELRERYPVSGAASHTVLGGASLGGLTSAYTAIEHPEVIGNVLSVSGSFWYGLERDGRPEWLTRRLRDQPVDGLRWYQQIGRLEDDELALSPGVTHLQANRNLAVLLRAQGVDHTYDELGTAHDICAFRIATMRGLTALLNGRR